MIRRFVLALLVAVLAASSVSAWTYLKLEQVTVDNTAGGVKFTAANINNVQGTTQSATQAFCRLRTAEISYTIDTTAPTTTVGMLWEPLEEKTFTGNDVLNNFRAIRTGAVSGQLDCTYSR